MSSKELRRAGVLARVKSRELKLVNAAVMMGLSYRQSKSLAKRYREMGAKGLKDGSAGRESNRRKSKKFRERVLRLVGKKYSGEEGERFGPTLAAEHLASDDQVEVNAQTLRRWMLLRAWVKKYGIPVALYTDWKNVYVREASRKEQLQGVVPVTQFGQMCQRLGIGILAANTPLAKGRVERNHGTHQDRLVKKMRVKNIQTHAEANLFLEKESLPEHNRRFRRIPAQPEDYHRAATRAVELEEVFHLETGRVIGNDWVVRHDNRYFQVQAQARQYAPAKGKVTVCEWEDGRLQIRYRGRAVVWEEIPGPVPAETVRPREATAKKQKPPTPKADHPWRQDYRKMRPWSKLGQVPLLQDMSGGDRP